MKGAKKGIMETTGIQPMVSADVVSTFVLLLIGDSPYHQNFRLFKTSILSTAAVNNKIHLTYEYIWVF